MNLSLTRALPIAILAGALVAGARRAGADDAHEATRAANERCATRLSIAFLGQSPTADALAAADPKQAIDGFLKNPVFVEQFARFINKEFNEAPGASSAEDAPYHIVKKVLTSGTPWSDVFQGKYRLSDIASNIAVFDDDNGLGYFRTYGWYARYEGNEPNGIKIATAYRIMNNMVGLKLAASTGNANSDNSATGRHAEPCTQCHFDNWAALDKVASVLPHKGQNYDAYKGGPQEMLGGKMIGSDAELVAALVESENFSVNACRLSFKYLYGRDDNRCDGPLLDKCVDTFKSQKTIQSALALIAHDPSFCE